MNRRELDLASILLEMASDLAARLKEIEPPESDELRRFSLGDRVVVTKQEEYWTFPVGTIGRIEELDEHGSYKVSANNDYWFYGDDELAHAPDVLSSRALEIVQQASAEASQATGVSMDEYAKSWRT